MHAERPLPNATAPEGCAALRVVEVHLQRCGLPQLLIELVKMRASRSAGAPIALTFYGKDAGQSEQRLYLLGGWRESPLYSAAERAALAWTETTNVSETHAPDADFEALRPHFTDKQIVNPTMLVGRSISGIGWRSAYATSMTSMRPHAAERECRNLTDLPIMRAVSVHAVTLRKLSSLR